MLFSEFCQWNSEVNRVTVLPLHKRQSKQTMCKGGDVRIVNVRCLFHFC